MLQTVPVQLLESLENIKGFDEQEFNEVHQSGEQVVSIRSNPSKPSIFIGANIISGKVPWSSFGYYLTERPSFTLDPLFHAGAYYVQEASSMFLEQVIRQCCDLTQPLRVLDLCAAPGGKSTLIQSLITKDSLLVSNEAIKARANILSENITKWGCENVVVTNNDPKDFLRMEKFFDLVVVDAPCSGSGLFRKEPEAIAHWSLDNVQLCGQRQQRILADILHSLKPGGILIYSTCSYSADENESISDWLLSGENPSLTSIKMTTNTDWGIVESVSPLYDGYGYRFFPDKIKGEGFYISAFKKRESPFPNKQKDHHKGKSKHDFLNKEEAEVLTPYLNTMQGLSFLKWQGEILAIPSSVMNDVSFIQSILYIKKAGVKIGVLIRDRLIPDHEFALSNLVADSVPFIDVEKDIALDFLRRKEININSDVQGWFLLKYQNLSLGWIKILSGRINNYYPKTWRILNK